MARALLPLLCLIVWSGSAGASEITNLPLGVWDFSGSAVPLNVSRTSPEYTSITLENPGIVVEERVIDFETYHSFGIPGEPFVMEEGNPAVPQISRFYRIPNTGSVEMDVELGDFELVDNINPLPLQFEGESFELRRSAAFDQDGWYPPVVTEMSEPMIMRDFRVVRVTLYPVQVNPVTHQARLYHNINVDLVANDTPGENEIRRTRPVSKSWVPIYQQMIANLDEYALDDVSETPGSYLILTKSDNNARQWADSLALWKKRKGFDVVVDARASWNVSQMTTAIRDAFEDWDPPLEFVAIVGDPQATFGLPTDGGNYDHSFALGNTGDDLEDVGCGRLCGTSQSEMATINAKIMGYERNPFMTDTTWFHKGFFYAGVSHNIASNWTLSQWGAEQFANMTGVYQNSVQQHSGGVSQATINTQLNGGVCFFFWRGGWVSEMGTGVAGSCNNGWKLPITMTITCGTGDFQSGLAVSESWLVAGSPTTPKGGVCAMGTATLSTHAPQNITVAGGLMYNIADLHVEHIGHAVNGAKAWLTYLWGPGSSPASNFSRWNNLLGDPGLSMWTDVPTVIQANNPETINVGAHHMALTVTETGTGIPVEDALVCLWKGDETYERGLTDDQGYVSLPLSIQTQGQLLVTVTKRNHKPYLSTVACVPAAQMVALTHYLVDDDNSGGTNGNSDAQLNPGETIDLPVHLKNFGSSATATNVTATIASENPRVSVISSASTFANIAPGDSVLSATPFRIHVASDTQHEDEVMLTLTVTASSVQTTSAFVLECFAADAGYISHQFTGTVNPGTTNNLRVTLHNYGVQELANTTAQLISLSPFVQVDDALGTYGNVSPGADASNTVDQFTITSNSLTFRGHQAPMRLIVSTTTGFSDTLQFSVSIGSATATDPTGPDAYGYFAYDNTDATYEMHPTFEYINISDGEGQNLNVNDTGEKTSPSPVWATARVLPFLFRFYGVEYDSVTICANGWLAFGNQSWCDFFRNYPIPAMQTPDAMIAPYWDDLRTSGGSFGIWQYYDEAEHRYIVQWKAGVYTSGPALDFEVILYDVNFHPTFDGNGQIDVMYNDVVMGSQGDFDEPNGCSIGIQAPGNTVGLSYAFLTTYAPGAATVTDGRAIRFTTDARMLFGSIEGTVVDAATNQPLSDVDVSIDGYSYHTLTDAAGHYLLDDVLIGTYTVHVHKRQFNDAIAADILVELDSTETVNFAMLHPEFELSRESIEVSLPDESEVTTFDILNDGNGPMDYDILITYAGDESPDPWDYLDGVNVTDETGDYMVQGCEFIGDYWWISGGSGQSGANYFYRFDTDGDYIDAIPQPSVTAFGWFDLAYDGELIYGSESNVIIGVNTQGQPQDTIDSPLNPTRAIAYDEGSDHFWIADFLSDIYEINRQGQVLQQVDNQGDDQLSVTGMAWHELDPDGYNLYLFCQNGAGTETQLWRMHPVSHDLELVTTLAAQPGDRAGGLAITPGWNSTLLVLGGILQNPSGDRLGIYEITFNTTWINVTPISNNIPGGSVQEMTVSFDPTFLRVDEYRVNLNIHSNVLDTTYILPVILTVTATDVPDDGTANLPREYSLYQNYPNPFNPSTTIRYDLKADGHTRLAVFNTLGQEVAVLLDGMQTAGAHAITLNAAALPSGVYFYRLESGDFVKSAKMMLLK